MNRLLALPFLLLAAPLHAESRNAYPAPAPLQDRSGLGRHVQRTMTLLATSTPRQRPKVRILFYGQSITEQEWSKIVADDLRRRFPHADLEIQNRAIGGFASQLLVRPAEHDLYPFYPDLLIFHVYGSNQEYEEIIRTTRRRTTAEILMATDHVTRWPPKGIDRNKDKGAWWDDRMNHHFLPAIAKKYGCGLADVRGQWLAYLRDHHLQPRDLLKDGVHLNAHGNYLMAELIKSYLVYRPDLPGDEWRNLVRTVPVGKDLAWKDGKLTLTFEGNRVDLLADPAARGKGKARVLIDGKKPSGLRGVRAITRPTPGPWSPLALVRVDHEKPLRVEDWTLRVTAVRPDGKSWEYRVAGSRTGPDGAGTSDRPFVSRSGRVKIEPGAWFHVGKVKPGYEIHWRVVPRYADVYTPPKDLDPARDNATTLAQGLANGKHTLELVAEGGEPAIRAVRVYRPPVR